MELKGIKAIVTGGGSGFGRGIAEALSAAGAKVWITGRNREKLFAVAEEIGAQGVNELLRMIADPEYVSPGRIEIETELVNLDKLPWRAG